MTEMGQVYAYLLKHRTIESRPSGRSSRPDEGDVANLLRHCDPDRLRDFQKFLEGQGLQLREYRDTDFKGIRSGGQVWVLMRRPGTSVPPYLGSEALHRDMALRDGESRLTTGTWFLHIWLQYLSLIYTRLGRGVSQVSEYQDAVFTEEQLIGAVEGHIETVRKIGVSSGAEEAVFSILDTAKGKDIAKRVKAFIGLMLKGNLIESSEQDTYRQTLLGAAEFAESFGRTMRHYLNIQEGTEDSLVNINDTLTVASILSPESVDAHTEELNDVAD